MVTVEDVKKATGYDDKYNQQIAVWIPLVYDFIKEYCNINEVPADYDQNAIKMVQYNIESKPGVGAESLSRYSKNYLFSYPPNLTKGFRRKIRW